jgi:SAM-dependent methyltransferase
VKPAPSLERAPFTSLASVYDAIMQDVPYDGWCTFVLREATARGWRGGRVLEVGCGTGNATRQMCDRGFDVVAIDASPHMAEHARRKCPEAEVLVVDVRELDLVAPVSLAFATFDTLNTMLDDAALVAALRSVRVALAPGGQFLFDANTTVGLRSLWEDGVAEGWADGVYYRWAHVWDELERLATVDAYCRTAGGAFVERHVERPLDAVTLRSALTEAGFLDGEIVVFPSGLPAPDDAERVWAIARRP